jgi:uncharacterized protein (TIGR02145 family)
MLNLLTSFNTTSQPTMTLHRLLAYSFAACASFALLTLASLAHAEPGMLRITTSPGDAQIFVNGQRKGNSPSQEGQTFAVRLPQGDYTVEVRKSDGKNYYGKKSVYVANDSLQTVNISLVEAISAYGQAPNGSSIVAGREWLRCSLGQSWSGSMCTGSPLQYSGDDAKVAADAFNATGYSGKRDWRVPTVLELASLIKCSSGHFKSSEKINVDGGEVNIRRYCVQPSTKPTIDTNTFMQTPDGYFWSSSLYTDHPGNAWYVNFSDGSVGYSGRARDNNNNFHVRLIRGSQ